VDAPRSLRELPPAPPCRRGCEHLQCGEFGSARRKIG
jgi:hypothetical protein